MNQNEQMLKAKELIQNKQYREARKLLEGIDHPTAKKWIDKIDNILLDDPFEGVATGGKQKENAKTDEAKKKQQQQFLSGCAILIIILSVIGIIATLLDSGEELTIEDESAEMELFYSCAYDIAHDNIGTILGDKRDSDMCLSWANTTIEQHLNDVRECHQIYLDEFDTYIDDEGSRIANFESCIIEHGIQYPALP